MIRSIRGTVESTGLTHLVVSVGGLGYLVHINVLRYGYETGDSVHLHTYLAVRETALDLYGFPTVAELEFFELLMTIPKIGPKSALQILGQADITILREAITTKDAAMLHKLSGIGKKTAENIVQFLHDKLEPATTHPDDGTPVRDDRRQADAIDALIALGYAPGEARAAVRAITAFVDTNDLVKQALRSLAQ